MKIRSNRLKERSAWKPSRLGGFTLIELLVVIAIIAILAALLFPVFARAKAAAKASASLSNVKQQALAVLMYANDFDDNFVIAGQWHSQDPDANNFYTTSHYMPWTGLVDPYVKNKDISFSPFTGATHAFDDTTVGATHNYCISARQCALLYPTYGYNATYLSPSQRTDHVLYCLSATGVAKPAEQVMLTEIWSRNNTTWRAFSIGQDLSYMSFGTSEAPDGVSYYPFPFGYFGWGTYGHSFMVTQGLTPEEGLDTGGVAFRCPGMRSPVAFADGHVKLLTDTQLAAGTDWVRGTTYVAVNLFNGKYLWDPRGE